MNDRKGHGKVNCSKMWKSYIKAKSQQCLKPLCKPYADVHTGLFHR